MHHICWQKRLICCHVFPFLLHNGTTVLWCLEMGGVNEEDFDRQILPSFAKGRTEAQRLRVGDNEAAKALHSQFFVTNEEDLPARLNVPPPCDAFDVNYCCQGESPVTGR